MVIGTSMGGARPKAVVEDDDGLWIAKFNRPDDAWDNARVEHAMLTLARACGLMTAESRVVEVAGRDVLLVKRFDRERTDAGYRRARMVSALTLLRAEDYALLLGATGLFAVLAAVMFLTRRLDWGTLRFRPAVG